MLELLAVIIIHSTPFDEVAQGPDLPQKNQEFSLEGGKTIVVQEIQFQGNSAISTNQLKRMTNIYLNRPLAETDLEAIQNRITGLYHSKGYNQVKVSAAPNQKRGVLSIIIQEGKKS